MTIQSKKEYLIYRLADGMRAHTKMDPDLFKKLDVKRGLRNEDGTGVLVGLTNIGNVVGYERREDGLHTIEGKLYLFAARIGRFGLLWLGLGLNNWSLNLRLGLNLRLWLSF